MKFISWIVGTVLGLSIIYGMISLKHESSEALVIDDGLPDYTIVQYSGGVIVGKWGSDHIKYRNEGYIRFIDSYTNKEYIVSGEYVCNESTDVDKEIYKTWLKQIEARRIKAEIERNKKKSI